MSSHFVTCEGGPDASTLSEAHAFVTLVEHNFQQRPNSGCFSKPVEIITQVADLLELVDDGLSSGTLSSDQGTDDILAYMKSVEEGASLGANNFHPATPPSFTPNSSIPPAVPTIVEHSPSTPPRTPSPLPEPFEGPRPPILLAANAAYAAYTRGALQPNMDLLLQWSRRSSRRDKEPPKASIKGPNGLAAILPDLCPRLLSGKDSGQGLNDRCPHQFRGLPPSSYPHIDYRKVTRLLVDVTTPNSHAHLLPLAFCPLPATPLLNERPPLGPPPQLRRLVLISVTAKLWGFRAAQTPPSPHLCTLKSGALEEAIGQFLHHGGTPFHTHEYHALEHPPKSTSPFPVPTQESVFFPPAETASLLNAPPHDAGPGFFDEDDALFNPECRKRRSVELTPSNPELEPGMPSGFHGIKTPPPGGFVKLRKGVQKLGSLFRRDKDNSRVGGRTMGDSPIVDYLFLVHHEGMHKFFPYVMGGSAKQSMPCCVAARKIRAALGKDDLRDLLDHLVSHSQSSLAVTVPESPRRRRPAVQP
ncbi:hypothetical protein FA13DRAFT_1802633 [Coprinellus micaceus]|uniref:Uncharacterized protein n=1 Tax=Coprinellus micaceus TaxID=71717 RepID=A0A4Y7SDS3_COPMI|nr:hypothetical protein FA13DRAFT_1802633 [Coprinellus micaceus]